MRSLSPRELWLLWMLPSFLVASAHFGWLRPDWMRRLDDSRSRISFTPNAPSTQQLTEELAADRQELERLRDERFDLTRALSDRVSRWTDPLQRANVIRQVSQLLQRNAVHVLSSASVNPEDHPPALSQAVRELCTDLARSGGTTPELWRFNLRGHFQELCTALGQIDSVTGFALPVSLSLAPAEVPGELDLTLWLWI